MNPQKPFFPSADVAPVYDAIIVGAGPAGLAAAAYLARANKKVLILEAEKPGGRLHDAKLIENYPGFQSISGPELADKMIEQAESTGVRIACPARAIRFELLTDPKLIWTHDKEYRTKAVLFTIGVQRKRLEIKGAREFLGMGVSYCPICDGTLFRDQDIALIGEDEDTIADGLYLSQLMNKIHFVPSSSAPNYTPESLEHLLSKGNVQLWRTYEATEIMGANVVEKLKMRNLNSKEETTLSVKGVFISGAKTPVTQMLTAAGVKTDTLGCIMTDDEMQTNIPSVYAAGDVTCARKYQIAVSIGQAVTAALNIIKEQSQIRRRS